MMKKWLLLLCVIVLLGYYSRHKIDALFKRSSNADLHVQEAFAKQSEAPLVVTSDQVHKGDLLLVNKEYAVPDGVGYGAVNVFEHHDLVKGFGLINHQVQLSPSLLQKFSTMVTAANIDGVNHFLISSGYRDEEKQRELYEQMGAEYAMPPGYSEHNLGLSLDIGSTQKKMDKAPEGKWLKENAWKYGFVLRYQEDKENITGIKYEAWHFRYVGLPHSAIMQGKNFVLEEYLDYLKEQKNVTVTVDHQKYKISYYPVSHRTKIHVPANGRYEISGNNVDGVIVTVPVT